jgi:hypothetical protein
MLTISRSIIALISIVASAGSAIGQATSKTQRVAASELAPSLAPLVSESESELQAVVARYSADRAALLRRYDTDYGKERRERLREFERGWQTRVAEIDFNKLGYEGRIDHVLLSKRLTYELTLLDREDTQAGEMRQFAPQLSFTVAGDTPSCRSVTIPNALNRLVQIARRPSEYPSINFSVKSCPSHPTTHTE